MHNVVCGGHYMAKIIAHKILRSRYWWPSLFFDTHKMVKKCDAYQKKIGKLKKIGALPLRPKNVEDPFQQWGIDFINEFSEKSSGCHIWILVAIDYFTKCIEAIPIRKENRKVVINFIIDNILIRFGTLARLITDNAMCFRLEEFANFYNSYGIIISYSFPYHPQGNRQVESSNKSLMKIMKRVMDKSKRTWDSKLKLALWGDTTAINKATKNSHYELVYGQDARIPMNNLLLVYKFI